MPRLSIVAVLTLGLTLGCGRRNDRIYADLPRANGVREGATVRYRGIDIGVVEHIAFVDTVVRLTIKLTRRDAPLRSGDRVRTAQDGVFGDRALHVVPGPAGAPLLRPGVTLGAAPLDSLEEIRNALIQATVAAGLRNVFDALRRDSTSAPDSSRQVRPPTPRP
jgi:ABC-type transporter Mla subunit MlaD